MEVQQIPLGIPCHTGMPCGASFPDKGEWKDQMLRRALVDYRRGGTPSLIRAFLMAKCEALRWLEERFEAKNSRLEKPMVPVYELESMEHHFADRYDLVRACQDFLRLDHHRDKSEWLADLARSPAARVAEGRAYRAERPLPQGGEEDHLGGNRPGQVGIASPFFPVRLDTGMMRIVPTRGIDRPSAYQALYKGALLTH